MKLCIKDFKNYQVFLFKFACSSSKMFQDIFFIFDCYMLMIVKNSHSSISL